MTSLSHYDKRSIGQALAAAGAHKRREAWQRLWAPGSGYLYETALKLHSDVSQAFWSKTTFGMAAQTQKQCRFWVLEQ